ncbi:MAG: polysaccharide deacetylase family protein [Betaproteobacteria bacterium]|nr:polysaccharide deacetylase family protein [Betaproteobacteria bacterium]
MFHAIGSPALEDRQGLFSIKPDLFREHLAVLAEKGGRVVPFSPAVLASEGPRLSITFDDGYRDNLEVAAPMLAELGLPFTVFVPSEFVRQKRPGFMTPEMLRRLAALPGACVGAHGAGHVKLTDCDDSQLQSELVSSRYYLEDVLGAPVETMAYPYGAVDQRVRNATEAAGYVLAACSHAGLNDGRRDPLLIRRTEILSHDKARFFCQKLDGHWDWYRWRTPDPART